ncbi:MAG TPA: antibiotic biosynthesis monooxygenase [Orrella sp.]
MVTEIAHLVIKAGQESDFEKSVALAKPHFLSANGCHGVSLARCIEHPEQYQLFVQWETVEHHMVEFRESENFQKWRELASPHFAEPPRVEHIEDVSI